jgi:predicted HicB family RNase H-like nuclease
MKAEKEQTTLRLPAELKEDLMREAQELGYSFNEYVLLLIHRARRYQPQ